MEYGNSAKDTPSSWGATRTPKSKNTQESLIIKMQQLGLGDTGKLPIKKKSLKDGLKQIFTNEEMNLLKNK